MEETMLVIVRSAPDTTEGKRGVRIAVKTGAGIIFLQNGVYFAQKDILEEFSGTAYVLDDDTRLRGLKDSDLNDKIRCIGYDSLVDLITGSNKVIGMF
jgi:sulfur relay protein TusB/DsrH